MWNSGMSLEGGEGQTSKAFYKLMEQGMPSVKPLATYALEREPCTRAVATHKARKSVLDGKDGWLQFCLEMNAHPIRLHSHVTEDLKRFDTQFVLWRGKFQRWSEDAGEATKSIRATSISPK